MIQLAPGHHSAVVSMSDQKYGGQGLIPCGAPTNYCYQNLWKWSVREHIHKQECILNAGHMVYSIETPPTPNPLPPSLVVFAPKC